MKENKIGTVAFFLLALIVSFGIGFFAGHTTDRNSVQISITQAEAVNTAVGDSVETKEESSVSQEPTGPVDLNTADQALLEKLPGIGPVLAERIINYRAAHGSFVSVEEIKLVEGIGEKKFKEIELLITVGGVK